MSQNIQADHLGRELRAILHGAAVARLDDRAFLRVTGSDATRWLNGMVTNSVQALAPGEGCYTFLLNAQGRILGDLTVYRESEGDQPAFVLATGKQQIDAIQKHLDHFIIMDEVELTQPVPALTGMLLLGPNASHSLTSAADSPLPALRGCASRVLLNGHEALILTPPFGRTPAYEVWFNSAASAEHTFHTLKTAVGTEASPAALEAFRLLEGRPLYGRDITDRYLPQETNQPQALHFNKGCYLGQEIVERIRSRGQVHRLLTPLTLTGPLPTEFPAPIEADGKPAGEITSAALVPLPEGEQILALGYVRREALDTGATLTYLGGTASPRSANQIQAAAAASKEPARGIS